MHQSAIETVLTLTSDGRFVGDTGGRLRYIPSNEPRRITLYWRSGLLPKVRGKVGAHVNKFFTFRALQKIHQQNDGRQALAVTFKLLNIELEAIYGRPIDWVQVIEPTGCPEDTLRQYLQEAQIDESRRRAWLNRP